MGSSPDGKSVSERTNGKEFHQGKIYFTDKYLNESNSFTSEVTKIAPINSLLLCVRAPVGIVNITQREICIGRGLCCLFPNYEIDIDFWFYWMQFFKNDFETKATGTTFKAISVDTVKSQLIPIPPMEEQIKIVKTIDNLFEKIDSLNKNTLDLQTAIKQAKSKILDLAIHGKLVPQDPNHEPAEELLKRIATSDNRPYKKFEDEVPFEIPENWGWCKLGDIGKYKKGPFGSSLTKAMFVPKSSNTVKVYEQKNAIQKNHNLGEYYITREYFESKMKSFEVFPNDVIVSCAGTIGETYILPENIEQGIINQALMKMKISKFIDINYFLKYFDHILKEESVKNGKGTVIKNIPPFDVFKNYPVPLPPLAEQQRIVTKIEKLFKQLDSISEQLA